MINKHNFKISVLTDIVLSSRELADIAVFSEEWFLLPQSGFFILNNFVLKLCMFLEYEIEAFAISLTDKFPSSKFK